MAFCYHQKLKVQNFIEVELFVDVAMSSIFISSPIITHLLVEVSRLRMTIRDAAITYH